MRHTTANMKKANSSAVASADDQRAKTNFDVPFYRCWLVSRPPTERSSVVPSNSNTPFLLVLAWP